jgi:ABC-2 type transport system ATP-binding protein
VGLLPRAHDKVKTYSHGMKQRLGIAQALLGSPEFVILDEPTSGLDPQGIKEVRELIQRLSQEGSITVFLSSHLLTEIEQTATGMAIINQGSLVVQGRVAELLSAGPSVVRIDARPIDRAQAVLTSHRAVTSVSIDGNQLLCAVARDALPLVTKHLVDSGLDLHAVVPRRSLEEYFLAITEGASDVHAPAIAPTGTGRQGGAT